MENNSIFSAISKEDAIEKLPLVEIVGQNRVLIENHRGVVGYSPVEIQIKVRYGKLSVAGSCLKFMQISREQLVITGKIDSVTLCGR